MVLKERESAYTRSAVLTPTFQIISQYSKIPVERMEFDDFVLVFNVPYKINVRHEDGYFVHEDQQLDMTCWGKTLEELFDAVFEEFHFLWKDIALEEDGKLDGSAQKLKQILLIIAKEEKTR
ncbi:MAG: hypothetical protein LBK40_04410 [Spirochaetaceae bacterium]|jgi:hypothetical protein|nr:hypothetical protein [Spirochaetaceae bacterium]